MPARMPLGVILLPSVAFAAGLACSWVAGWAGGRGVDAPVTAPVETATRGTSDSGADDRENPAPAWDLDRAIARLRSPTATDVTRALDDAGIDDPLAAVELRLAELARYDVGAALAEALAWPGDSDERLRFAEAVIATAASVDPARAVAAVVAGGDRIVEGTLTESVLLNIGFRAWAEADLAGLTRELETNPYWKGRRENLDWNELWIAMAKRWPDGGTAGWFRFIAGLTLPTETGASGAADVELFGVAAREIGHFQDPKVTDLSELVALPPSVARDAALVFATRYMDGPVATGVPELVSESFRDLATAVAAQAVARDDARLFEAVDFLGRNTSDEFDLPDGSWAIAEISTDDLVRRWLRGAAPTDFDAFPEWSDWVQWMTFELFSGSRSPAERAGLAAALRDDWSREFGVRDHLQQWSSADPAAASEWVAGLGDHPAGQAAIEGLVLGTAQHDPGAAAAWASEIADPSLRERMTHLALGYWVESDPAGALAALPSSGLAPGSVEALALRAKEGSAP